MFVLFFSVAAITTVAFGANITFASEPNCESAALYGAPLLDSVPCTNITSQQDAAFSAVVSALSPSQIVTFYSDDACTQQLEDVSQDQCYTPGSNGNTAIGSFLITDSAITTDVVPYGIKLSNYKGMTHLTPWEVNAALGITGRISLGITKLVVSGAISFAAAIAGCVTVATQGPDPVGIFGCIAGPISTLLSAWGAHDLHHAGRRLNGEIRMSDGSTNFVSPVRRRSIDWVNEEYVNSMLNASAIAGMKVRRVGLLKRDLGTGPQHSPVIEIDGAGVDGFETFDKWHMTAHWDDLSGGFIHHIYHASQSEFGDIEARDPKQYPPYPYDSIRWAKHGIDAKFCRYETASLKGYGNNGRELYKNFWYELKCYVGKSIKNANVLAVDMYNEDGRVVSEAHLAPYLHENSAFDTTLRNIRYCSPREHAIYNADCASQILPG